MQFKLYWLDISEALEKKIQPRAILERPRVGGNHRAANAGIYGTAKVGRHGEFWVPGNPINEPAITWEVTNQGEHVSIPVQAYLAPEPSKAVLVACALELGLRAGFDLGRRCHKKPVEISFVLGHKVDAVEDQYRYYLGLAVQVE